MASRSSLSASDIQKAKEAMEVLGRLVDSAGPSGARNDPSTSSIGDETKKGLCSSIIVYGVSRYYMPFARTYSSTNCKNVIRFLLCVVCTVLADT